MNHRPALTLVAVAAILAHGPLAASELRDSIAADYEENLAPLFRHFHQNPELSHLEFETARTLAAELRALGYDVTEQVGGTGVVAVLANGAGPQVLLRADMDGLPVRESSGLPYASTATQVDANGEEQPVMHACGHDVHMTALIGAARQLAARRDQWSGTLVLIGQPAEEIGEGARAMIEDGLYERFPKPDYALAFHVSSLYPAGKIEVPFGIAYSSVDSVDIVVRGVGAHGAYPHRGVDPVLVASQIVVGLQSIVSRTLNPLEPGVITVGSIHGGTKHNIIGDRVDMQLTVRADGFETRELLLAGINRVADGVARAHGVPEHLLPEVTVSPSETTPPLINDEDTAARIKVSFSEHFGADTIIELPRQGMGGEDFANLIAPETGVRGVYFRVGGTHESELATAPSHHSPLFKIEPEPAITVGAEALVVGAMTLMPAH
jgi:amidohydrolase